jgi:hypothetical protein
MIQDAWNISVFIKMWFLRLPKHNTYADAYEDLEAEFVKKFGRRRYKNYGSFEAAKRRYYRLSEKK